MLLYQTVVYKCRRRVRVPFNATETMRTFLERCEKVLREEGEIPEDSNEKYGLILAGKRVHLEKELCMSMLQYGCIHFVTESKS